MALAVVQSAAVYGTTVNVSIAFGSACTAGNSIIAGLTGAALSVSPTGMSSSPANTFTRDVFVTSPGGINKSSTGIWSAPNIASGSTTVSCTGGTGAASSLAIYEISGTVTASVKDQTASNSGAASTSHVTGTTATTTVADEFVFVADTHFGNTTAVSLSAGYTLGLNNTDNTECPYATGYKIVAATGTQTATFTWDNAEYAAAIATYKAAGGGGGGSDIPAPLRGRIYSTLVRL